MQKIPSRKAIFIPLTSLLMLCLFECSMLIWTPYSFFYSRGIDKPNVDYVATTYGDMVAEDIFVTKNPRKARYVTDQFGGRNEYMPKNIDILIFGESYGFGAGIDHELTPAVQLSAYTGYSTAVAPQSYKPLAKKENIIEKALHTIKHSDPTQPRVILLIYVDKFVWDWNSELSFSDMLSQSNLETNNESFLQKFHNSHASFKEYFSQNSPVTILSRKFKTYIKTNLKRALNYFSLYSMSNSKRKYYPNESKIIGYTALHKDFKLDKVKEDSYDAILKIAENHKQLYDYGMQNNVIVIPLIVPVKPLAYYNEINGTNYYSEFPGVIFEEILKTFSIPVVSVYPEFLKAIKSELNNNGAPIYWGDDSHWNALGIKISMKKAGEAIEMLINKTDKK